MHILFLLGWFFMLMAFITAASEPFVVVTTLGRADSGNFLTSAYDLWYTYAPGHLVVSKIKIEAISPILWDPLLVGLLQFPAWFLFGVPGIYLAWTFRPSRIMTPETLEEYERQKESMFLIDELNRIAGEDESYHDTEDDRAPVYQLFDLDKSEDEDIRNSLIKNDIPAGFPDLDNLEEIPQALDQPELDALYADIARHEKEDEEKKESGD